MDAKTHPPLSAEAGAALYTQTVSAIVVTYHTGAPLRECLDQLEQDACVREIIIVDNGNPPGVITALRARRGKTTLISGHGNIGFARGCNLGAASARAPYLAFVNPDVVLKAATLPRLIETGRKARAPWIAGARLLWPDGSEQRGARRDRITVWSSVVTALGLGRLEKLHSIFRDPHREKDPLPAAPMPVDAVSGAMMLMRAEDFAALKGFDEGYFLHVEDIDLCRRANDAGGQVIFDPSAKALHYRSTSDVDAVVVHLNKAKGLSRYFRKFSRTPGERLMVTLVAPALFALMMARGMVAGVKRNAARKNITRR